VSDGEALLRAESYATEHPVELWEGERLVRKFELKKTRPKPGFRMSEPISGRAALFLE
jgi:hypothetical protein